ncbi:MAG: metallophosphoesterase [Legionella sp.]|nr:metallophosphoesterase [Legionella sp.]
MILCWVPSVFAAPQFLTISDIHYSSQNNSRFGQDTGKEFLAVAMNEFSILSEQVDFILHLGDMPTHTLFRSKQKKEQEALLFHQLYTANTGKKPMFYITGNNDSLAGNYQAFASKGISPLNEATDWNGACAYCDKLIIDDSHMRSGGYYSSYVIPDNKDILLITLNTTPWAARPIMLPVYPNQERDALAELQWLELQLKNNHARQLLIAMHIPPGKDFRGNNLWRAPYLKRFLNLLERNYHSYKQITLLASHTHMDEVRKIHLPTKGNVYALSTPSISRVHQNNPGMKIFSFNDHFAMKNYTTYFTRSLDTWNKEHYHALGNKHAIFSGCEKMTLTQCLDSLTREQICDHLEKGHFYGVKSLRVYPHVCSITFPVN